MSLHIMPYTSLYISHITMACTPSAQWRAPDASALRSFKFSASSLAPSAWAAAICVSDLRLELSGSAAAASICLRRAFSPSKAARSSSGLMGFISVLFVVSAYRASDLAQVLICLVAGWPTQHSGPRSAH